MVQTWGSEVDRRAWELELCSSAAAEFHVVVAYMERRVLECIALVMVHLDRERELVVAMDLMVVAHGGFWVAMLVGLGG